MDKKTPQGKLPFEVVAARFTAGVNGQQDSLDIDIKRNLTLSTEIDELYLNFVLRDEKQGVPAYYGGWYVRRTNENPNPTELDSEEFTVPATALKLRCDALPNGPASPSYSYWQAFEIEYIVKPPKPPFRDRKSMLIRLTPPA